MSGRAGSAAVRLAALVVLLLLLAPALSAKLEPASEEFYRLARHFMTRDEAKRFLSLPSAEQRAQFIEAFWQIRDPDPTSEANEFQDELQTRFDFVSRYFREANRPGWDTARGMVYLVLGPPDIQPTFTPYPEATGAYRSGQADTSTGLFVWPYQALGLYVYFIDRQGFGLYELDMARTSPRLLELMRRAKTRVLREGGGEEAAAPLEFKAEFAPAADRVRIVIPVKELRYEIDAAGAYTARLHLALNLYLPDGSIVSRKDERRVVFDPQAQGNEPLAVDWTIPLARGKNQVDLLVLDQVGDRSNRQFFTVKKK